MKRSQLFTKTLKSAPSDAETANARLLVQGGFVHQEMAGVYSWLPLGLRVLRRVEAIIREEMNTLGAQEVLMSALQPKENWMATKRWDEVDVLFKVPSQTKKEYALGPTHEEIVTPLVGSFLSSYKDLPCAVFQIQSKFRDELRAKSGVLRGREFGMKDLYSFHATQEDLETFYERTIDAYTRVFMRCGVQVKVVESSGGAFTKKFSHEFQIITDAGEDVILACPNCSFAQNSEITSMHEGDACPSCGTKILKMKGVEAGNIFNLGTKFADAFHVQFMDEHGERQTVHMGCYGIGTTRLVGAIVEAHHDAAGIMWPRGVAPFSVQLVTVNARDASVQSRLLSSSQELYDELWRHGIDVLWDDRETSAGEKLKDADLLGLPLRILLSEKTLNDDEVEWKARSSAEVTRVKLEDVVEELEHWTKNT